jgi:hypothetical protein
LLPFLLSKVAHCEISGTPSFIVNGHLSLAKFELDEDATRQIDNLHKNIGAWLDTEFRSAYKVFEQKYNAPPFWVYGPDGQEFMPETFY